MIGFLDYYRIPFAVITFAVLLIGLLNRGLWKNKKFKAFEYMTSPILGVIFISLLNNLLSDKPLNYLNLIHYVENFSWMQFVLFFLFGYNYTNRDN
jgi:hypothetical protein